MPLYVQLAELFRQRIVKGVWKEGEKLPSLDKLVEEFEVARVTVRQAVDRLARDGLVSPQRGRGTFVTGAPRSDRWLRVETVAAQPGRRLSRHATRRSSTSTSRRAARAWPRATAWRRRGTSTCAASTPTRAGRTASSTSISTPTIFARHPARFRKETVIPLLMAMPTVKIATARQVLTISTADLEVAHHLGISVNAPVAEVRRVFTGPKRRVIYLGEVTYRGDFVHVEFDLKA